MAGNPDHTSAVVRYHVLLCAAAALMMLAVTTTDLTAGEAKRSVPDRIPPKRSSQIENGLGGVNPTSAVF